MRIVQISDLHLSREYGYFYDNWKAVLEELNADPPDLVVIDGDVSFNGADRREDLEFAREEIANITVDHVILPGNHDIGDHPKSKKLDQPVNKDRLKRWHEVFGPDRFSLDTDSWRILGFNTELMGSGLPEEEEQWQWLSDKLADSSRPVILFQHKPLFAWRDDETEFIKSCVDPPSRKRLWPLLEKSAVKIIASAHVHVYKNVFARSIEFVWCPATSFIVSWEGKDVYGGIRRAGYLEYKLNPESALHGAVHKWIEPERLVNYDLRNWFKRYSSTINLPPNPRCP
jgi:hypothetical protein